MNIRTDKILGASLALAAFSFITPSQVQAQTCVTPPTCESLGYTMTEADCEGHIFLKCPFDTSVGYCDTATSGSSGKCDNPTVGGFLYSDMSCSTAIDGNKTVIGIVFEAERRLAIALDTKEAETLGSYYSINIPLDKIDILSRIDWYGKIYTYNIENMFNLLEDSELSQNGFYWVWNYSTPGTVRGDWFIPSTAQLQAIYDNLTILNQKLSLLHKDEIPKDIHWSSTSASGTTWALDFSNQIWTDNYSKDGDFYIRPVIQF